ncbi:MAG: 2-keto-4-pentenoate hydratase [Caulobacteraceae bacterium]|nr:2-keto-4-pentenoate hydratase [Caulobacteraceae bacterium]
MTARREAVGVDPAEIASRFVQARGDGRALEDYPGPVPASMAQAYAIQEAAIRQWPDVIAGWKIGRVPPPLAPVVAADRLAGPIFARHVSLASRTTPARLTVVPGGFAAVEAEVVFRLAADAPPAQMRWTPNEALALVAAMHIGVEFAASPLATINILGPTVVASDFGNNAGLVLGPEIAGGAWRDPADLTCETWINGARVGVGSAASLLGGPVGSLVFLLEHCAARGRPLKAGCLVTTGQLTGIHDIQPGDRVLVSFGSLGEIRCEAVAPPPK